MNHEIKYNGISANPTDYVSTDGDLAISMNAVPEDGSIKPIFPPKVMLSLSSTDKEEVMFIHKTASFMHYIVYADLPNKLYYIDAEEKRKINFEKDIVDVRRFDSVGNTLIAFTDTDIHYFLWKDYKYNYLGTKIPDLNISFGLIGHPRLYSVSDESKSDFTVTLESEDWSVAGFTETDKTMVTEQIMAKLNKFIADQTVNKGRFCFPFFVRYALRLYDGSLVGHSAPILMTPSTTPAPIVLINGFDENKINTDIMLVAADLDYQIIQDSQASDLINKWGDIVKSVEVFISKPIYTYNQDGKIESTHRDDTRLRTTFVGKLFDGNSGGSPEIVEDCLYRNNFASTDSFDFLNYYCEWEYYHIYAMYFSKIAQSTDLEFFNLPTFTDNKIRESIENTHSFFKLTTIELGKLTSEELGNRNNIVIEEDYLQSLVTREVLTDDYLSHDKLSAKYSFNYNNRLNLSGIRRTPFNGFYAQSMFAYCDGLHFWSKDSEGKVTIEISFQLTQYIIRVYIKENGNNYITTNTNGGSYFAPYLDLEGRSFRQWGNYVFYPNPNAYAMQIICLNRTTGTGEQYVINLKRHEFLNGAFAFIDFGTPRTANPEMLPSTGSSGISYIDVPNKIYTSEVNNPFFFPLLGINTIGTGEIVGISTAAKALSQGQFGQFPLYAFTTDGIWALEVSPTGTYSAKQPISRDVCTNSDSITQLDSAVLFTSDKGLMIISGSTVQCISDIIDSENSLDLNHLPASDKLTTLIEKKSNNTISNNPIMRFKDYLIDSRIVYDYENQRIIVANPNCSYAYVYSMKSSSWGMMTSNIKRGLNSYPEALAMTNDNKLVNYSELQYNNAQPIFLLTRPFKLDQLNSFKTINGIIQRGNISKDSLCQILYGSNDLINWHVVYSSNNIYMQGFSGTPFKYFKLAIIGNLSSDSSLFGCSIDYKARLSNKTR